MGRIGLVLVAVLAIGCGGRTGTMARDSGGLSDGARADLSGKSDGARKHDASLLPDAVMGKCPVISEINKPRAISNGSMAGALINRKLTRAVVQINEPASATASLFHLRLDSKPKITVSRVPAAVRGIEWLGDEAAVLVQVLRAKTNTTYDLAHLSLDGKLTSWVKDVCGHRATPDGKKLFVVSRCSGSPLAGTLELHRFAMAQVVVLDKNVSATDLAVSPDSAWVAYIRDLTRKTGCYNTSGQAWFANEKQRSLTLGNQVLTRSLAFYRRNHLLYRRAGCTDSNSDLRTAMPLINSPGTTLTNQKHDGFWGYFDPWSGRWGYAVSPDNSSVLVAQIGSSGTSAGLIAVNTSSGNETALSKGLFPYSQMSLAFRVWNYSRTGGQVVFASTDKYPNMGLSSVPVGGGTERLLSDNLYKGAHAISPTTDELVLVEVTPSATQKLLRVNLGDGAKTTLFTGSNSTKISHLRWLAHGRALLFVTTNTGGQVRIRYVSRLGKDLQTLAQWTGSVGHRPFAVDTNGCAVIYGVHGNPAKTFIRSLPQ